MAQERINLSININYVCNTCCSHCNRGIGVLDWSGVPDMTVDDARRLVDAVERSDYKIHKIKLMGGEPTIHPHLLELVEIFLPISNMLWVVTNGMKKKDQLPTLPRGAKYKVMELDDKDHHAFFVSPADLGIESLMMKDLNQCIAMQLCGRGVEPEGFTQCSLARTIVAALGQDVSKIFYDEPAPPPDYEICKHCPLSLGTKHNKVLSWRVSAGQVACPTESFKGQLKDGKILHPADAHVRRAQMKGEVHIIPVEELTRRPPRIEDVPKGWNKYVAKQVKAARVAEAESAGV